MKVKQFLVCTDPNARKRGFISASAAFSRSKRHRYLLTRVWDESKPKMALIGLNPSTASHLLLDPTITRVVNFAKSWGYGSLDMLNLFAYRATQPRDMKTQSDPIGRDNDGAILCRCIDAGIVIVAWGNHGSYLNRDTQVTILLSQAAIPLHCLGTNSCGSPKHPLYLPSATTPIPYN